MMARMGSMAVGDTLASIDLGLPGRFSGKVRDGWPLVGARRLLVTTDRLSAFDRVHGLVPGKGQVLNELAAWWFAELADVVDHHLLEVPDPNVSVCIDAQPLPVEVVVRARLTGSTSTSILPRYLAGEREMYGITLPDGLEPHGPLPHPIITPTTKAVDGGHDEPVTAGEVVSRRLLDAELWDRVQRVALEIFARGTEVAEAAGFVLADTKYEFGLAPDGRLLLIDEVHTPDSSRFWDAASLDARLAAGKGPESFDKEPVRLALRAAGYSGDGEPPVLDASVWAETSARYVSFYERLTGRTFEPGATPIPERIHDNLSHLIGGAA